MQIKNTHDNYGFIAKLLHWGIAVLILGSYISVYYRQWFTEEKTPENWNVLQLHLSIGVSIGALVLLRII
jgi:cytochrome b561